MSAYVVDLDHIAYLVRAGLAVRLSWTWPGTERVDRESAQRVGQMLWDENVRSVRKRYAGVKRLPGPLDEGYRFPGLERVPVFLSIVPVQVIKACDCYEYQSCEHREWHGSEAEAYVEALRGAWTRKLLRYEDAVWGAPVPDGMGQVRVRNG